LSLVVDEHRQYLNDPIRLAAFGEAIAAAIRPGFTVLDLASGTGVLGLLACRAGASRVYSIEVGGMIEVARELARRNGYSDRIRFIKGLSTHVDLPERVDAVVADQVGNFGFNAGVIQYFADARARFLKPGGITIPGRLDLVVCPLDSNELYGSIEFWNSRPAGFDFSSVRPLAANTGYQVDISPETALGDPARIVSIDLSADVSPLLQGRACTTVARKGTLHGVGGWFETELAPGIRMTNSPLSSSRISRRQIFFPADGPVGVAAGDMVEVRMSIRPADLVVNWSIDVLDGESRSKKAAHRHSTWKGMLHSREDLERTKPDFVPVLTPRGQARRTVVDLCDGVRTVADVEEETWRRHPALFRSREEAAEFVAEVVTRYASS
jgi:protein arginine N-methyltransferase 1